MKEDKKAKDNSRIMRRLLDGGSYTTLQIAEQVGLSEKTVRTKMDLINDWLEEENLGRIERRQGKGIWLAADENQKKRLNQLLLSDQDLKPAACQDSRNKQLIGKLLKLKPGEITTLQQLADSLYLSPPTVGGLLRDVAGWFSERSLRIVSMRSKGVCLEGEEYSFRIAIRDYMMDMMPGAWDALLETFAPRIDTSRIWRIIVEAENAWRIELADNSFKMVWLMTCLSLARNGSVNMGLSPADMEDIQNHNEYSFAESIYQRIEKVYQIGISEEDVMILAILLLTAKKIKSFTGLQNREYTKKYDRDLEKFVKMVIDMIGTVLAVDLSDDEILQESLLLHMRSAIFRMKYSTAAGNNISKYVKEEYKQTFLATWSTSNLFEEYYDIQVTEDELAGIALYIQAAIIRQKKGFPLTALLLSDKG